MNPTFIFEVGINHHGDFEKAKRMCEQSKLMGADICKFQFYDPEKLLGKDSPYYGYAKKCQFTKVQHEALKCFCDRLGLEYLVTVFDVLDIRWATTLCNRVKIASRMNRNDEFVQRCIETRLPVIMSIQDYSMVKPIYKIDYMWCVTKYPAYYSETMGFNFDDKHGLSSHCPDWNVIVDAYDRGARLFEAHVCEDRKEAGCDIPASLTFRDYATAIWQIKHHVKILAD